MVLDMILTVTASRFTKMEKGQCIIGMKRVAMIPLISFDALVNVGISARRQTTAANHVLDIPHHPIHHSPFG